MATLLDKTREINKMIQKTAGYPISFEEMARVLSKNISANTYIIGKKGKVLGYALMGEFACNIMETILKDEAQFPDQYNNDLLSMVDTNANLKKGEGCVFLPEEECPVTDKDKYTTIVPINGGGERLGTLMLSAYRPFEDGDLVLAEYGATVVGIEILRSKAEKIEEIARQKIAVNIAFSTLSHSELEAIEHVFNELGGDQGLLVASKIADKLGITRSTIVNALRKLESAGVVDVRSLGMKGTYIKVLNDYLLEGIEKNQGFYSNM